MDTLGICRRTLTRWTNTGKLAAVRVGNANRYDPAHFIAYLEARQIGPNA
jgi:predicted site-specific integrase-resolvase